MGDKYEERLRTADLLAKMGRRRNELQRHMQMLRRRLRFLTERSKQNLTGEVGLMVRQELGALEWAVPILEAERKLINGARVNGNGEEMIKTRREGYEQIIEKVDEASEPERTTVLARVAPATNCRVTITGEGEGASAVSISRAALPQLIEALRREAQ